MSNQTTAVPFRSNTKAIRLNMPSSTLTSFGQTAQRIEMLPTGYMHKLWVRVSGTITTGTGTPGNATWVTYPELPWGIISKIRLYVTPGVDLINISGLALKQFLLYTRRQNAVNGDLTGGDVNNLGNIADNYTTQTGTVAASTAYTFNMCFEIPVSTDDSLLWGLVPLQNNMAAANLEITLAGQSQITNVTGVTVTPNFTIQTILETFQIPEGAAVQLPFLGFAHKIIETVQSITNTGENIYRPLINPVYIREFIQCENNGLRMGAGAGNTAITNFQYRFAQQVYLYNEPYTAHIQRAKAYLGKTLPDGCLFIDGSNGLGEEGIVDVRDFINTSQQTSVQAVVTIAPGTTLTNAQMRVVDEYLTPA